MTELNTPVTPAITEDVLDPGFHPIAGNTRDDDGQALDQTFEPMYTGPVASESYSLGIEETKKTTRILSRSITLDSTSALADPVMILPADPNRLHIRITATAAINITSDKTDVYGAGLLPTNTMWPNDYHTGAVWVYNPLLGTSATVSIWSITC